MISGKLFFYQLNYFTFDGVARVEWIRASNPLNASISAMKFIFGSDISKCSLVDINVSPNSILWSMEF